MSTKDKCAEYMKDPQPYKLWRMGFPREKTVEGKSFNKLCRILDEYPDSKSSVALLFEEFRLLERELGRSLINSGDILFGCILVNAYNQDEELLDNELDLRGKIGTLESIEDIWREALESIRVSGKNEDATAQWMQKVAAYALNYPIREHPGKLS
tara:strand:+ start:477 stop:941 length:465 start_codon:yes stop_codon:yes gene_type:complete